jgi:hypothetical protein
MDNGKRGQIWWCRIVTTTLPKSETDDVEDYLKLLHFNQTGIPPYLGAFSVVIVYRIENHHKFKLF